MTHSFSPPKLGLMNRSSKPLAKFFSSQTSHPSPTRPRHTPSFSNDLLASVNGRTPLLVDPVTGDARLGASTSGREAARVVKFSPEGTGRDLLVFSEVSLFLFRFSFPIISLPIWLFPALPHLLFLRLEHPGAGAD
jgi:hypothetical protein